MQIYSLLLVGKLVFVCTLTKTKTLIASITRHDPEPVPSTSLPHLSKFNLKFYLQSTNPCISVMSLNNNSLAYGHGLIRECHVIGNNRKEKILIEPPASVNN
jgi:hypothetical protein